MYETDARRDVNAEVSPPYRTGEAQRDAFVANIRAAKGALDATLLEWIADSDHAGVWEPDGCYDMAQWVVAHFDVTGFEARRYIAAGHALKELPLLRDALVSGGLGLRKVVELARFATSETEQSLIRWATRVGVGAIKSKGDRERAAAEQDAKANLRERYVNWVAQDDGRVWLEAMLTAEQGHSVTTAIADMAKVIPSLPCDDASESVDADSDYGARCADALVELVAGGQRSSGESGSNKAKDTVVVHADLAAILGATDAGGVIESGPVIHPELLRKLACDARLQFVVTDKSGDAPAIGHTSRNIPVRLERAVRYRDSFGCTFPGCERKHRLSSHHCDWAGWGGATEVSNLTTVCQFHHSLVHELGWRATVGAGGITHWFRPDGSLYLPAPAQVA